MKRLKTAKKASRHSESTRSRIISLTRNRFSTRFNCRYARGSCARPLSVNMPRHSTLLFSLLKSKPFFFFLRSKPVYTLLQLQIELQSIRSSYLDVNLRKIKSEIISKFKINLKRKFSRPLWTLY